MDISIPLWMQSNPEHIHLIERHRDFNSTMDAIKRIWSKRESANFTNFNSTMDAIKPFLLIPLYQRFRHTKWIKKSATLSDSPNPGRLTDFLPAQSYGDSSKSFVPEKIYIKTYYSSR